MKKKTSFIAVLLLSLSVFAAASGCGKKGPPMPPEEEKSLTEGHSAGQAPVRSDEAPSKKP